MMQPAAYFLGPGEQLPGEDPGILASANSSAGAITVIDSQTTGGAPMHVHENEDECFFVIDGEIEVRLDNDRWRAQAGGFVFLPRGVAHAWDVVGEESRLLIITVPGGFEQFLRGFHAASNNERDAIARQYGITFLPDPER